MFPTAAVFTAFLAASVQALSVPTMGEANIVQGDTYSGDGTWYNTGLSACGTQDLSYSPTLR